MRRRRCWRWPWLLLAFCFFVSSAAGTGRMHATPADSLDSTIRYHAFEALFHRRTGVVYDVPLPANLSGVQAAVVRMRSRTLWLDGVSIRSFRIPPRTVSIPPARRLIIVYQDLGNRSSSNYYHVQNYSLATPVLGLQAYDADANYSSGTVNSLDFDVRGDPIVVSFPMADLRGGSNSTEARCMTFGSMGSQRMDNLTGVNECLTGSGGHFSIIVPKDDPLPSAPPPAMTEEKKRRRWVVPVIAFGSAVIGLIVLCSVGAAIAVFMKRKREEEMRRQAEEGEVLETVYVRGSKMPAASMSRTLPVLENGSAP